MAPRRQAPKKVTKTKHQIVTCVDGVMKVKSCSENDPAYIIQQLLVKVGDPVNDGKPLTPEEFTEQLGEHLPGLAGAMDDDIENNPEVLATNLLTCASFVPLKVSLYGTFSGLVNVEHEPFGLLLLKTASTELQQALDHLSSPNAKFRARLLLQYLGEMVNAHALDPESFIALLEQISTPAPGEDGEGQAPASVAAARTDFLVYLALSCLPWCGQILQEKCGEDLDRLMASVGAYVTDGRKPFATLSPLVDAQAESGESSSTNIDLAAVCGTDELQVLWG